MIDGTGTMNLEEVSRVTTTPKQPDSQAADDFISTEQLIRQQDVHPIASPNDVATDDPFGSDDEHADFLADLYASRRSSIS
jgi:hypothetical protein